MRLTKIAKKAPKQIAEALIENFDQTKASIEKIEIAGPGIFNFYMNNAYLTELIPLIITAGETYRLRHDGGAYRWRRGPRSAISAPATPMSDMAAVRPVPRARKPIAGPFTTPPV